MEALNVEPAIIAGLRVKHLRADLLNLEKELSNRINHAQVLRRSGGSIEPRIALETATQLEIGIRDLERHFSYLTGQAESILRGANRTPPAQIGLAQYEASDAGLLAELRPATGRIVKQLRQFSTEVRLLSMESNERVNDPGRYGSAAAACPVNDLADALSGILDLIGHFVRSRR